MRLQCTSGASFSLLNAGALRGVVTLRLTLAAVSLAGAAQATTYSVGPSQAEKELSRAFMSKLKPGDIVEVDGDATYKGDIHLQNGGTAGSPLTIRGKLVNGKRPVISGGVEYGIVLHESWIVFENFELTNPTGLDCVVTKGNEITVRDVIVHDCKRHGLLSTDDESGSLTLEYSEFYKNGNGEKHHQIYVTSEEIQPGSVFRMRFNYVHDANGGNNVKSRSERNEIYYNWIEGAAYYDLQLIGDDYRNQKPGIRARHSDVVGNVIVKKKGMWFPIHVGGDNTGESNGRVRFVNNTVLMMDTDAERDIGVQIFDGLESLEAANNIFYRNNGSMRVIRDQNAEWVSGRIVAGQNNWVVSGSTDVPNATEWTGTMLGTVPGIVDLATFDVRPKEGGDLIDKGTEDPKGPAGHEVPNALKLPAFLPPFHTKMAPGGEVPRPKVGTIDLGAFEFGSGPPRPIDTIPGSGGTNGTGGADGGTGGGNGEAEGTASGCSSHVAKATALQGILAMLCALGLVVGRRRNRE